MHNRINLRLRRMGGLQPPSDAKFIEHDAFAETQIGQCLDTLHNILTPELLLRRDITLRNLELAASWIKWYCKDCHTSAEAEQIPVRFALTIDYNRIEMNIFIRYYTREGSSVMHRICMARLSDDEFACKEYA